MSATLSIIALIVSTVAGAVCGIAYWKGKTDNELGWLKQLFKTFSEEKVLERMIRMETKFEFIWHVFVEQLLTERPRLATKSSPLKPTEKGMLALSEVMGCLNSKSISLSDQVLYDIPRELGMDKLRDIADRHEVTLAELLALVSLKLSSNHCGDEKEL